MPTIYPPTKENSCYFYRVYEAGLDHGAYLTYELYPQKSAEKRSVLLVKESNYLIDDAHRDEYHKLIERIREYSSKHFGSVKNVVNRLADGEINLNNIKVVVHRFGAVPVYVLPDTYEVTSLGERIQVQLGIYPNLTAPPSHKIAKSYMLPFLSTKSEFVRSLNVGLDIMFRRYLEDVGEGMFDIENHLDLPGVFDRAKEIETILAESINTKLQAVMPSPQSYRRPTSYHENMVNNLFKEERDWILTARYARQYALYFINELYRHIGLASRSEDYLNGFIKVRSDFNSLLAQGFFEEARDRIQQISTLSRTLRAYTAREYDRLNDINTDTLWVKRFVQFARFISMLNKREVAPTSGRMFLSYIHEVPESEVLRAQIEDYINHRFQGRVRLLYVSESRPGVRFREVIKSQIWSSDIVEGIIPRDTQKISGTNGNGYLWIALEAEHGLLLGKQVIFIVEKGTDVNEVVGTLESEHVGFLAPDARVPAGRAQKVLETFNDYTRSTFSVATMAPTGDALDPKVRDVIDYGARLAIKARHEAIVLGFFNQFPEQARRTLVYVQHLAQYPRDYTKQNLAFQLHNRHKDIYPDIKIAEKAINAAWVLSQKRALLIKDRPIGLMRRIGKSRYSGMLGEILRQLRPDWDNLKIVKWEQDILRKVLAPYNTNF